MCEVSNWGVQDSCNLTISLPTLEKLPVKSPRIEFSQQESFPSPAKMRFIPRCAHMKQIPSLQKATTLYKGKHTIIWSKPVLFCFLLGCHFLLPLDFVFGNPLKLTYPRKLPELTLLQFADLVIEMTCAGPALEGICQLNQDWSAVSLFPHCLRTHSPYLNGVSWL